MLNILLGTYLATTAFSYATMLLVACAIKGKLQRDGFEFVKLNQTIAEKMLGIFRSAAIMTIPVFNFITAAVALIKYDETAYTEIKFDLLMNGKIARKTETNSTNNEVVDENVSLQKDSVTSQSVSRKDTTKTYDEMTLEEKKAFLERERRILENTSLQEEKGIALGKSLGTRNNRKS